MSKIVKFETAKIAKEKGLKIEFDCDDLIEYGYLKFFGQHHYTDEIIPLNIMFWETHPNSQQYIDLKLYAPTQGDLHEWLRKEHKIFINIKHITFNQKFGYSITGKYQNGEYGVLKSYDWTKFESYEECLENALIEALNFIK